MTTAFTTRFEFEANAEEKFKETQKTALLVMEQAKGFPKLSSPEDYQTACILLAKAKQGVRDTKEQWKPAKKSIDDAKAEILKIEKAQLGKFEEAAEILEAMILEYRREEESKAKRQEALRIAEARDRAETDALNEALMAEAAGDLAEASQILEGELHVPPVVPMPIVPEVGGVGFQKVWKARVVNPDLVPEQYKLIDLKALDSHAKSLKERAQVPGVEFYYTETTRTRRTT